VGQKGNFLGFINDAGRDAWFVQILFGLDRYDSNVLSLGLPYNRFHG